MFYETFSMNHTPFPVFAVVAKGIDFPSHWHSETEIIYCCEGEFSVILNGCLSKVAKGQVLFIGGAEPHEFIESNSKWLCMKIGTDLLEENFKLLSERVFEQPILTDPPPKLLSLLDKIIAEINKPQTLSKEMIKSCMLELAVFMLRELPGRFDKSNEKNERILAMLRMNTILDYAPKHCHEKITVESAAKMVGYDESYFYKQFKKATHMTFHQYLNAIRVSKACSLLINSDEPVIAIAEQVGFHEAKTFFRVFKALKNITPSEYRNTYR